MPITNDCTVMMCRKKCDKSCRKGSLLISQSYLVAIGSRGTRQAYPSLTIIPLFTRDLMALGGVGATDGIITCSYWCGGAGATGTVECRATAWLLLDGWMERSEWRVGGGG